MKKLISTAALLAALSAPAYADGHAMIQSQLDQMGISADASTLSASELAELQLILNGSNTSPAAKQAQIEQILSGSGTASTGGNAMIQAELDKMGIEADTSTLTGAQLAQLEFLLNGSTTSPAAKQGRIELILEGDNATKVSSANGRVMVDMSMNSLRNQVSNTLESSGVQCDVYALSDDAVAEIYLAVTSSMSSGDAIDAAKAACI